MKFTKYLIIALAAVIILSVSSAALAAFNYKEASHTQKSLTKLSLIPKYKEA